MSNPQPGQMLGPYQIISQVGKGGMATVYKAYHAAMDRYVAVKILPHEFMHNDLFLGRFQQEVRLIAKLEHKHILPVYDYGESKGIPFLVMRFLDAGTLKDRIQAESLSLEEVNRYFTQLAEALAYAHAKGVVHRDIKPSNALVDETGDIFLMDFGIAKIVESTIQLTATGAITGTPAYMSPEQGQGLKVDHRTDIYSLGVVLYEMITGRVPFEAETPMAVIFKKVQEPLPPPSVYKADINPEIEAVVLKSLAKNPADRFPTTQEFLTAWKRAYGAITRHTIARPASETGTVTDQNILAIPKEKINRQEAAEAISSVHAMQGAPPAAPTHPEVIPSMQQAKPGFESTPALAEGIVPRQPAMPKTQSAPFPWKWLLPVVGLGGLLLIVITVIGANYLMPKIGGALAVTAQALAEQSATATTPLAVITKANPTMTAVTQLTRVLTSPPTKEPTSQLTSTSAINLHDLTQWDIIRSFSIHRPQDLVFSPDGKNLAAAPYAQYASLWEMPGGEEKSPIGNSTGRWIYSVAFSPDSKILATAGRGWLNDLPAPEVTLWDATSGLLVKQLWGHKADVHRLAFSPDGSVLASGSGSIYYTKEGEVILWDIPGGNRRALISTYTSAISLAFSPDGNILAVGTGNEKVILFDAHKGTQLKVMEGQKGAVVGVAFSSDGRTLVSASVNNQIFFWDVNTGERLRMSSDPLLNPQFYCMALSPDGNVIATGSTDKIIRLWDFETGNTLRLLVGEHITTVNSIAFSPDGTMLASSSDATGSEDGKIILWGVSK